MWLILSNINQDSHEFIKACDRLQRDGRVSRRQELSLNPIIVIRLFNVWVIDIMGPLVSSHVMNLYSYGG